MQRISHLVAVHLNGENLHKGERPRFFTFDGENDIPTGVFVAVDEKDIELGQLQAG
ncbi:MAG: hypothetical protein R3C03_02025 [Pirellulaceae bacterium]